MNVRLAVEAMGTRFELVLHGEDEFFLRAVGEQAIDAIQDEHRRLSLFDPQSEVSRINASGAERPVRVDRDLLELLEIGARVYAASDGAFDPAVGALMRRWGHRGAPPPDNADSFEDTDGSAGFAGVTLDRDACTVSLASSRIGVDLGGIAKGYALDRAGDVVREAGVTSALLHGGTSSIVAIGAPPGARGWRVRLGCLPEDDESTCLVLCDTAISISAPSGRVSDAGAGHIIDPRSGQPADSALVAVAGGCSATLADAWSTALVVLGSRPGTMPDEIGSAVLSAAGWAVSPSLKPAFETGSLPDGNDPARGA